MSDASDERWLPVVGWEGKYEVSDLGRVRGVTRLVRNGNVGRRLVQGRILKLTPSGYGYPNVMLWWPDLRKRIPRNVHVMVAEAFLGPCPSGLLVRHLDDDKTNNRLGNLAYGTQSENLLDATRNGRNREANRTHCRKKGHEFTPENTIITSKGGRLCRTCREASLARYAEKGRLGNREWRARKRAGKAARAA